MHDLGDPSRGEHPLDEEGLGDLFDDGPDPVVAEDSSGIPVGARDARLTGCHPEGLAHGGTFRIEISVVWVTDSGGRQVPTPFGGHLAEQTREREGSPEIPQRCRVRGRVRDAHGLDRDLLPRHAEDVTDDCTPGRSVSLADLIHHGPGGVGACSQFHNH
jgi:hypothetical protein